MENSQKYKAGIYIGGPFVDTDPDLNVTATSRCIRAGLAAWPEAKRREALVTCALLQPADIAEALFFMLTRPRDRAIQDLVILLPRVELYCCPAGHTGISPFTEITR